MSATLPAAARWDGTRILFEIAGDGELVACAISREALREVSGRSYGKPAELLASFNQARPRIEAAALAKYRRGSASIGLLTVWAGDLDGEE